MSVRMRHTSSHTKNRRSHHALVEGKIVTDKDSGNLRLPHRLDEVTGMYRGKQIAAPKAAVAKKSKKEGRGERSLIETTDTTPEAAPKKDPKNEGLLGRMTVGKAKSRSGFGGGA